MAYATALQALADPTRRKVLETLARGPRPVGEIAARLPVSRPAVSQHLKALEAAGLVHAARQGTRRIYRADPAALGELRAYVEALWREALAAVAAESERERGNSR
jgi:DNA-binding transcriptional ArsR family regulator